MQNNKLFISVTPLQTFRFFSPCEPMHNLLPSFFFYHLCIRIPLLSIHYSNFVFLSFFHFSISLPTNDTYKRNVHLKKKVMVDNRFFTISFEAKKTLYLKRIENLSLDLQQTTRIATIWAENFDFKFCATKAICASTKSWSYLYPRRFKAIYAKDVSVSEYILEF